MKLCDYEVRVLRECNGESQGLTWGAAMGAALETLKGRGLVECRQAGGTLRYTVTAKGEVYLAAEAQP